MNLAYLSRAHFKKMYLPILLICVTTLTAFTWQSVQAQATPIQTGAVLFSDDFSGNLDKWQLIKGEPAHWSITNGQLVALITTGSTLTEMIPRPDLLSLNAENISISFEMTPLQGIDRNFSFWHQDSKNWAELHFTNSVVQLIRILAGKVDWLSDTPYVLANNTTYSITVNRYRDKVELLVNGTKVADHIENSGIPYDGSFALRAGTGSVKPTKVAFDNFTVTAINTSPSWSTLKQSDPKWASIAYDHAQIFSNKPTIARWGCLLTSLVMNFQYHGLVMLPTGEPITPATLNTWLLSQNDGYIGEGLINWQAVTRLSKQIHDAYGTPKLEYQRYDGSSLAPAIQALNNKLLPIISIPGHFLVATGVLNNGTDLTISDPGYAYTKFSQHNNPALSTRVLVPSFTDLSYIMITHDPRTKVEIIDAKTKQPMIGVSTQVEYLAAADGSGETSRGLATTQLAKPASGNYILITSTAVLAPMNEPTKYPLSDELQLTKVYTYTATADYESWSFPATSTKESKTYWLRYSKDAQSDIKPTVSFASIQQTLNVAYATKQVKSMAVVQKMNSILDQGNTTLPANQVRIVQTLKQFVSTNKTSFKPNVYTQLQQEIDQLLTQLRW